MIASSSQDEIGVAVPLRLPRPVDDDLLEHQLVPGALKRRVQACMLLHQADEKECLVYAELLADPCTKSCVIQLPFRIFDTFVQIGAIYVGDGVMHAVIVSSSQVPRRFASGPISISGIAD